MTKREELLIRIQEKGGLYGFAAGLYLHDPVDGSKLIIECFEQCHNQEAWEHWGQELVLDIISYAVEIKTLQHYSKVCSDTNLVLN